MNLISNKEEIKQLQGALEEISNAMLRMDAEKELIKEIKATVIEEHKDKLTMKILNKLAKTYYKDNYSEEVSSHEEFSILYETITQKSNNYEEN